MPSNDAKITYTILKDRLNLSIKNNWINVNSYVFLSTQMKYSEIF
ncbi:replication initiator protein A [Staphylococcus hominis]|nr:replication initiator protein A [Staphylococcus hominis]MDS3837900.1 replication initiator protein A [Staphylococcus hominis]